MMNNLDDNIKEGLIRTRFAPSPTGYLHVGSLRTALYAYLTAKKKSGTFILRIEDTDQNRYVEGSVEKLIESLLWADIVWDEGPLLIKDSIGEISSQSSRYPDVYEVGKYGPYIQSERLPIYRECVETLLRERKAYHCFCDAQRLEKMRQDQLANKRPPMYDRTCLSLDEKTVREKLDSGSTSVIRMKVERGRKIIFEDLIRGKVCFESDTIDDQVIMKSDGYPTYHLAVVVDDHLMKITHVIRGEEWVPSTPKHVLLYEAFRWNFPRFAHLPLLLNPDRSKLSKRQGDVSVSDYVTKGYLKDAIINFVALLGWNPGQGSEKEIFSLQDLIELFRIEKVHKSGAVFDIKKLDWINSQYIKKMPLDDLYEKTIPFLESKEWFSSVQDDRKGRDYILKVLHVERDRMVKLSDVGDDCPYLFFDFNLSVPMLAWKNATHQDTQLSLEKSEGLLKNISQSEWTCDNLQNIFFDAAGDNRGGLLWPFRVALSGSQKSPSPFELAWVLGKETTLSRVHAAIQVLQETFK